MINLFFLLSTYLFSAPALAQQSAGKIGGIHPSKSNRPNFETTSPLKEVRKDLSDPNKRSLQAAIQRRESTKSITQIPAGNVKAPSAESPRERALSLKEKIKQTTAKTTNVHSDHLIFDLPVTYNKKVSEWVSFFQKNKWFANWLQRSYIYMPMIQAELKNAGLPEDLAYMVMIESGFIPNAVSSANAVGPWQFISATGSRYGLKKNWWLDERRDLRKSTLAAIKYLTDLHNEFGSWYLVAASYNMGENGLRRRIKKHGTKDYWELIKLNALPKETQDYVPKILAAMLIAKAPNLYGFRNLQQMSPLEYDLVKAPGGTDLEHLAKKLGVTKKSLKDLNAELYLGYIPRQVAHHTIRVPKGAGNVVTSILYEKSTRVALE